LVHFLGHREVRLGHGRAGWLVHRPFGWEKFVFTEAQEVGRRGESGREKKKKKRPKTLGCSVGGDKGRGVQS